MVQLHYKPSQSPLSLSPQFFSFPLSPSWTSKSLWSNLSLHPSFPLSAALLRPMPRKNEPPPLLLSCYCLPHPPSLSPSFWSALRVLFIQQQPTQSRAEQNRAVRGVWLAKVGITSETQQNSFTPSMPTTLASCLFTTSQLPAEIS